MREDCNKWASANKEFVRSWHRQNGDKDIGKSVSVLACSTGVPCVVIAYYLGEFAGWPPEIVKSIQTLIDFYGYTEILNTPEGAPQMRFSR